MIIDVQQRHVHVIGVLEGFAHQGVTWDASQEALKDRVFHIMGFDRKEIAANDVIQRVKEERVTVEEDSAADIEDIIAEEVGLVGALEAVEAVGDEGEVGQGMVGEELEALGVGEMLVFPADAEAGLMGDEGGMGGVEGGLKEIAWDGHAVFPLPS